MTTLRVPVGADDHVQGPATAAVTLVEYGDYECPHCGHAYPIVKQLQEEFGDDLRFVFRNFPLANAHPHAQLAAEAAEAAGAQGKFWEMHDWLFENQDDLSSENIVAGAEELGLDMKRFVNDSESRKFQEKVKRDFAGGVRSGVNGTPTFFINGVRHDADFEYETLTAAIQAALAEAA
ncbi:MAG: DsbA family protein [Acidobacteriota bacterium]|nr:DsbA family protein [Acidobacteriota bacterium]